MSKKKRKMSKNNVVWQQSAEEATLAKMPRYNGYACGHGVHGDVKYNRKKAKRALNRQLKQEGASWGSFRFDSGLPNTFTGFIFPKSGSIRQREKQSQRTELGNLGEYRNVATQACRARVAIKQDMYFGEINQTGL